MKILIAILFMAVLFVNSTLAQYEIGDEFYLGNFKYCVNRIEYTKEVKNSLTSNTADGIYLIVYLTVTNTTRESRTLTNTMFKVSDSEGYEFETSQNAMIVMILNDLDKVFMLKDISPKIPKEIIVPFEVPNSNDIYKLKVFGGFGTGKTASVTLKK